jgi:hypothetical protein
MHGVRSAILSGEGVHPATPVAAKKKKSDGSGRGSLAAISVKREESRLTNQRREERHRDIFEEATIYFRRRKYHVPVVNASASGVMVEAGIEPRIGEAVQIQFNDCNRTQCAVRWIRGNRIGLEFNQETTIIGPASIQDHIIGNLRGDGGEPDSEDQSAKANRTPRHNLIWIATVHCEHQTMPVRLRNISADGAMLEAEHEFTVGAEILLDLEEAGTAFAKVRWARGGQVGIKFNNKFNLQDLTRSKHTASSVLSESGKTTTYMLKPHYLESEMSPDSPWAAMWERLTLRDLSTS